MAGFEPSVRIAKWSLHHTAMVSQVQSIAPLTLLFEGRSALRLHGSPASVAMEFASEVGPDRAFELSALLPRGRAAARPSFLSGAGTTTSLSVAITALSPELES